MLSGLSSVTVNNIENGKIPNVSVVSILSIARALDIPISLLLDEELTDQMKRVMEFIQMMIHDERSRRKQKGGTTMKSILVFLCLTLFPLVSFAQDNCSIVNYNAYDDVKTVNRPSVVTSNSYGDRNQYGMSLDDLAVASGLSRVTMNNIELGKLPNASITNIVAISQALDVPIGVLVGEEPMSDEDIRAISVIRSLGKDIEARRK